LEGIFNSMTLTDIISKVTRYAKKIIVTDNSSSDAVQITQAGLGNSISANAPIKLDSGPAGGSVIAQDTFGPAIFSSLQIQRGRGTVASPQIVQNGDVIGGMIFYGYDGSTKSLAGQIVSFVDGTPASGKIPIRIEIQSKTDANNYQARVVVDNSGNVGVNTTTPASKFHVAGDVTVTFATTSTSVGAAGAASALPAQPVGYLVVNINGAARKIPYYNV
jgi:hypothetical protein